MDEAGRASHADPVDGDDRHFGVDALAEDGDLPVDGHPSVADQVVADSTAAEAGAGEHLLQSRVRGVLCAAVDGWCHLGPLSRRRSRDRHPHATPSRGRPGCRAGQEVLDRR